MADVNDFWMDLILFVLASPVLLFLAVRRALMRYRYLQHATRPNITCECGEPVSLVGMWRCSCGFTYRGHLLRVCPVCGSAPVVVRCYRCGVTTKLPDPL
jgi:hypothetical protein